VTVPISCAENKTKDTVSESIHEEIINEQNATESNQKKTPFLKLLIILAVTLVTTTLAYFFVSTSFSSAPYKNEVDMLFGILGSIKDKKVYTSSVGLEVVIEPRSEEALLLSINNADLDLSSEDIPDQGHLKYQLLSTVDFRHNETIPDADMNFNLSYLAESIIFDVDFDVKIVNDNIYARINQVPDLLRIFIPNLELLIKKWILMLENISDKSNRIEELIPNIFQPSFDLSLLNSGPYETERKLLSQITKIIKTGEILSNPHNKTKDLKQVANIISSFDHGNLTAEEKEILKQVFDSIKKYPILKFVDKPKKITEAGEELFQYEVNINHDNIINFLRELAKLDDVSAEEVEEFIESMEKELIVSGIIDEFNRLFSIKITVDKKGIFRSLTISGLFVVSEDSNNQIRTVLAIIIGPEDETINIAQPDEVYDKTLDEIITEMFMGPSANQTTPNHNRLMKHEMSSFRGHAETSYHYNSYAYTNVCIDLGIDTAGYSQYDYRCNSNVNNFIIYAPLEPLMAPPVPSESDIMQFYCIDSTGVATEVKTEPNLQAMRCL